MKGATDLVMLNDTTKLRDSGFVIREKMLASG